MDLAGFGLDMNGKDIVVFYDDAGKENNVKRKEGKLLHIDNSVIVFEEKLSVIVMPLSRVIRIEISLS